ncbi:hypothetical protein HOLleu_16889 [Holothuria leucospilota]|uniref:Uncharacterized protein n=1 Tax=Holothuria leucospilota TaxID=206669 RepID=A0A9Q1H845_HOLLE|nr:hypothetical protein HOLleu_16889 [Holothuria leucospilota]
MERRHTSRGKHQGSAIDDATTYCKKGIDQPGFEVRFINNYIGHGVFTTTQFEKGAFLLEYRGEHITAAEGGEREENYPQSSGSFLFFYKQKW